MKKLFITLSAILLAAAIVMTILFVKETEKHKFAVEFTTSCIQSFYNSVDYSLCTTDVFMGNVNIEVCQSYYNQILDDINVVNTYFPRTGGYNYIGK